MIDRERRACDSHLDDGEFGANFPMALDEGNSRLFMGAENSGVSWCRHFDGKPVADIVISNDTDDLFYDAKRSGCTSRAERV